MESVTKQSSASTTPFFPLKSVQTVMLGKFKISQIGSNGLIKPCRARNIAFFFRSTFSWGERHAKIVLQDRTSRVDRRMGKLLNALGNSQTSNQQIGRSYWKLHRACMALGNMSRVAGYRELVYRSHQNNFGKTIVDREAGTVSEKMRFAFKMQLRNLDGKEETPQVIIGRLRTLLDLVTSRNAIAHVGGAVPRAPLDIQESVAEFVSDAVTLLSEKFRPTLLKLDGKLGAEDITGLVHCAAQLERFKNDVIQLQNSHDHTIDTDHLDLMINNAISYIDGSLVELSIQTLVGKSAQTPQDQLSMKEAVEALEVVEWRQNNTSWFNNNIKTAIEKFEKFHPSIQGNQDLTHNVLTGCRLAGVDESKDEKSMLQRTRKYCVMPGTEPFVSRFRAAMTVPSYSGSEAESTDDSDDNWDRKSPFYMDYTPKSGDRFDPLSPEPVNKIDSVDFDNPFWDKDAQVTKPGLDDLPAVQESRIDNPRADRQDRENDRYGVRESAGDHENVVQRVHTAVRNRSTQLYFEVKGRRAEF